MRNNNYLSLLLRKHPDSGVIITTLDMRLGNEGLSSQNERHFPNLNLSNSDLNLIYAFPSNGAVEVLDLREPCKTGYLGKFDTINGLLSHKFPVVGHYDTHNSRVFRNLNL